MGFDWEEMFGNTEDLSDAWESACMDAIDQWVSTPPRKKKKDTYCGTWHNQRIQFKQNWGGQNILQTRNVKNFAKEKQLPSFIKINPLWWVS